MEDWYLRHPMAQRIRDYGFGDSVQQNVALLVYLDLCEAKGWYHVNVHPCHHLKLVFLTAKEFQRSRLHIVVPLSLEYQLSMAKLQNLTESIKIPSQLGSDKDLQPEKDCGADSQNSTVLAIVESGSTIVYYYVHCGLHPPTEGSLSKKLTQPLRKDERKSRKRRKPNGGDKKQDTREKRRKEGDEYTLEVKDEGTSGEVQTK